MPVEYGVITDVSYRIYTGQPLYWQAGEIERPNWCASSNKFPRKKRWFLAIRGRRPLSPSFGSIGNEWTEPETFDKDHRVSCFEHCLYGTIDNWSSAKFCVQVRPVFEKPVAAPSKAIWMQTNERMFNNGKYADAEVKAADGTLFKVHKAILSNHSDVLEMMFTHECIEKTSNQIQIANADVEVVEAMLRYIYSGKVEKLEELASRLILLADQYQLKDLTAMCAVQLGVGVSTENVFERLKLLSSIEHMSKYKQSVFKFVYENCNKICQSSEWIELGKEHGKIVCEYVQFLSSSK